MSILNLRKPKLFYYGKVKFENVMLSKRKIKALIDDGFVNGWDDPRLFTLKGLFNHGLHLNALNQFVATLGCSGKTPPLMSTEKLWTINKKVVDKISSRYFCLPRDNIHNINLGNITEYNKEIPKYIKNMELGMRNLEYSDEILISTEDYDNLQPNEEITLMLGGNAIVNNDRDALTFNPHGNFKSTNKKIMWVSAAGAVNIRIDSCTTFGPITSKFYVGERQLLNVQKGDYVQFIKMNYYMCTNVNINQNTISFIELN